MGKDLFYYEYDYTAVENLVQIERGKIVELIDSIVDNAPDSDQRVTDAKQMAKLAARNKTHIAWGAWGAKNAPRDIRCGCPMALISSDDSDPDNPLPGTLVEHFVSPFDERMRTLTGGIATGIAEIVPDGELGGERCRRISATEVRETALAV